MTKTPIPIIPKRKKQEEIVAILADKYDVTPRYVRMIISGEKNHEQILEDYLLYQEEHNLLLQAVKKVAPII